MDQTIRHFRDLFGPVDRLRYLAWQGCGRRKDVTLRMKNGMRVAMRGSPAKDYGAAYEVFVMRPYVFADPRPRRDLLRIVDLGAHCGYSVLFWAGCYPGSRILAFEPHPEHARQVRRHLELNRLGDRVTLCEAAAGVANGEAMLSDAGSSSSLLPGSKKSKLSVTVRDFYEVNGDHPIDILKIDVEGAEYELLSDPRFARISAAFLAMEWHATAAYPNGRQWCADRLTALGYQLASGDQCSPRSGILRAFHPARLSRPAGA